jgi:predicted O-methyltransferase YrrM
VISRKGLIAWLKTRGDADTRPARLIEMTDAAPTTTDYNRFIYALVQTFKPALMVETGTDRGRSCAHMALGNPQGQVVTIDIDPACSEQALGLELPNVAALTGDSLGLLGLFDPGSINLLFLDSLHTYEHTKAEWEAFRSKLCPGALVLIDDIALDEGMRQFWRELPQPKLKLNHLHFSGFGAWWQR